MARVELIIPKMGESVSEATIITWHKEIGDIIEIDDTIIEIATDKVDSEVPSTHEGKLIEKLFNPDDIVKVGEVFAVLEVEGSEENEEEIKKTNSTPETTKIIEKEVQETIRENTVINNDSNSNRFYSPLVKSMANAEGIKMTDLETIVGTGKDGRVTKNDMIKYLQNRKDITKPQESKVVENTIEIEKPKKSENLKHTTPSISNTGEVEIIEMDRMRKLISAHMTMSKSTSAHITSFVEADMTNIVNWRKKVKEDFIKREGQNITFTPIIIEAMTKAVKDFPMINVSVDENNIHIHKNINVGMATALPDGNLIVPVIKECQNKNLTGITKSVNNLANNARNGKLSPDDIQGGTITMTNVGTFGNLMGTPIINQPQVAIMACGIIKKKPVVIETEAGDVIAIRHMMYLSLSYDHRVVDGSLGGQYVKRVAEYLENFDTNTSI